MLWLLPFVAAAGVATEASAPATCQLQSISPRGSWRFFRVVDVRTGEIVMAQAINGGDVKQIYPKHSQVRVEHKLPGHTVYQKGPPVECKGGITIRR